MACPYDIFQLKLRSIFCLNFTPTSIRSDAHGVISIDSVRGSPSGIGVPINMHGRDEASSRNPYQLVGYQRMAQDPV